LLNKKFFQKAVQNKRLFHAYLFVGGELKQKELFVLELAKIINCLNFDHTAYRSCGQCLNCRWIDQEQHTKALFRLKLESKNIVSSKQTIKLEQIRELLGFLYKKSEFYRVVFVEHSEKEFLVTRVANSLLKTIEEFQKRVVFVFSAYDQEKVLPTIVSRCQRIYFSSKKTEEKDLTQNLNLAKKILQTDLSWSKSKETAEELIKNNPDQRVLVKNLEDLQESMYLELFASGKISEFKKVTELIEKSLEDIKSFCNPKYILKSLFYKLSSL